MITRVTPETWVDLQQEVCRVLTECGFEAVAEKTVATSRGKVELDVYAEESVRGRRYSIACECKQWRTRVPQTVVHAFRAVLSDLGVNLGYIISRSGFQSGAFEVSEFTNLRLLTWDDFLLEFEDTWYDHYFIKEIDSRLSPLMTYAEPFAPAWFAELSPECKEQYIELKRQHDSFGMLMQSFGPWLRPFQPRQTLPLRKRLVSAGESIENIPSHILDEVAYREFLEACTVHGAEAIQRFRAIRATVVHDGLGS